MTREELIEAIVEAHSSHPALKQKLGKAWIQYKRRTDAVPSVVRRVKKQMYDTTSMGHKFNPTRGLEPLRSEINAPGRTRKTLKNALKAVDAQDPGPYYGAWAKD